MKRLSACSGQPHSCLSEKLGGTKRPTLSRRKNRNFSQARSLTMKITLVTQTIIRNGTVVSISSGYIEKNRFLLPPSAPEGGGTDISAFSCPIGMEKLAARFRPVRRCGRRKNLVAPGEDWQVSCASIAIEERERRAKARQRDAHQGPFDTTLRHEVTQRLISPIKKGSTSKLANSGFFHRPV